MEDEAVTKPVLKEITASDGQPALESHHVLETMGTTVECTRVFRTKASGGNIYFILSQATDNDLHKVTPGFDLIVKTLTYKAP
jgi:hypothetical protein